MNALFKSLKSLRKQSRSKRFFSRMTMYVVRLTYSEHVQEIHSGQKYGNSKPCPHCESLLFEHGIGRIKYSDVIDGKVVLCELRAKRK